MLDRITMHHRPALEVIPELPTPFDLVFIDADKINSEVYFDASLRLSRVGTIIVVDNVVREGAVVNAESTDDNVIGIRRLAERVAQEKRVDAVALQTVGSKGYDGFLIARVVS